MKKAIYQILGFIVRMFFPRKPIVTANLQRILVVKLCCIGDILFTTPLLRALQEEFPRSRISYMVSSWCRELALADPRVKNVIEFNPYGKMSLVEKIKRVLQAVREIRQQTFDMAIVLHRTPLAGVLAALAGIPVRIGFDWQGAGFAHTHTVPFHPDVYEIERNLECLRPLGIQSRNITPELLPPPAADEAAQAFLNQHGYDPKKGPLVAIFPGGGVNPGTVMYTKRWPLAGYREVCEQLMAKDKAQLLLVGSAEDAAIGNQLLEGKTWPGVVIRSEGSTSLMLLAALLKRCAVFIGGDSGPMHMAHAVGTPTVSLFGPSDPDLVAPRGEQHRVIHADLPCMPCYNPITVYKKNVNLCQQQDLACMNSITSQAVLQAAEELLVWKGTQKK